MNNLRLLLVMSCTAVPLLRADLTRVPAAAAEPQSAIRSQALVPPSGALVSALDTNRDGALSATEITWAPTVLQALDANHDGRLESDEISRVPANRRWMRIRQEATPAGLVQRMPASFTVAFTLDANQDGEIQSMEIANAVSSLRTLDANHDGVLTSDELRPIETTSVVTA